MHRELVDALVDDLVEAVCLAGERDVAVAGAARGWAVVWRLPRATSLRGRVLTARFRRHGDGAWHVDGVAVPRVKMACEVRAPRLSLFGARFDHFPPAIEEAYAHHCGAHGCRRADAGLARAFHGVMAAWFDELSLDALDMSIDV